MGFLRNPEIRQLIRRCLILAIMFAVAGFWLDAKAGLLVLAACLVFLAVFLNFTQQRYTKLAQLSLELDRILHGAEEINLADYAEGELAILHSQLAKMTIRLREQADALQQDKIYLTDAIADISHQLRTPLTALNLIVSLLRQDNLSQERRLELARELQQLLTRIDWLIEALLKLAKIDAGAVAFQQGQVELTELVAQAAAPFAIAMELRQQNFAVEVPSDASYRGDLAWSCEAVGNVIKNCLEHTPTGGTITVTGSANAMYTELMISDNGKGIDPADLPYLFQRFYKGKNASPQSVGIGLALARSIVTAQNGTIKAKNRPEGGASFTIRFYQGAGI